MEKHNCGGTILQAGNMEDGSGYYYCDHCYAFVIAGDAPADARCTSDDIPSGTDAAENRRAFDLGECESPEA